MLSTFLHLAGNPLTMLYLVQALTYGGATLAVRYSHRWLWAAYATSALIHMALALVHAILILS
jgi:hypothetical protein